MGTVNLMRSGHFSASKQTVGTRSEGAGHRIPDLKRPPSQQPVVDGPEQMSAHAEEILHYAVHGHEKLHVGSRLEAPHLALALPGRLVGDFRPIVRVLVRAVDHRRHHGTQRRRVAA